MQVIVKNQSGNTLESIDLDDAVFGVPMNRTLVHQALVIYQGNKRQGTHDTKTRAQVSGGGRKPWIQKHTGRARQGSTRSPQWRHGGVAFGPHPRSYRRALPRRMRRLALRCVLSDKARQGQLVCLDAIDTINGKTKSIVQLLSSLNVSSSALLVTRATDEKVVLAAHNVTKVWTMPVNQLNAEQVLSRETVIMTVEAARWAEESLAAEPHGRRGLKYTSPDETAEEPAAETSQELTQGPPEDTIEDLPEGLPEDLIEAPEQESEEPPAESPGEPEEAPAPRRTRRTAASAGTAETPAAEAETETPAPPRRRRRTATAAQAETPDAEPPGTAEPAASPEAEAAPAQEPGAEEEG
jgi:large subunit ribosomal protein L4